MTPLARTPSPVGPVTRGASVTEIARQLGVSRQLVSKVLNGGRSSAEASDRTRRRVLKAAQRLGYRPNAAARTIATGRFNAVGLLMSQHRCQSTVFGDMLRGMHDGLAGRGIHLTVNFVDDEGLTSDDELPKILGQAMVDGLLLNYTHGIPPRMAELIRRHRLPAVWVNSKQAANCVYPDDEGAGHAAARLLLEAGHRRVAFVDLTAGLEEAGETHYSHADRRAGYERAMAEAGLESWSVVGGRSLLHEALVAEARRVLARPDRPTALVGYSHHDADAAMQACLELGLAVGRDVGLVIIEQEQPLVGPPIDTLVLPEFEIGRAAAAMLLARLDDAADQPARMIPMRRCAGATLAPRPAR